MAVQVRCPLHIKGGIRRSPFVALSFPASEQCLWTSVKVKTFVTPHPPSPHLPAHGEAIFVFKLPLSLRLNPSFTHKKTKKTTTTKNGLMAVNHKP